MLITGCGNSTMAVDILDRGYDVDITCLDLSDVVCSLLTIHVFVFGFFQSNIMLQVIEQMKSRHVGTHPSVKWVVGDVCNMTAFPGAGCFDLILDSTCCVTCTALILLLNILTYYQHFMQRAVPTHLPFAATARTKRRRFWAPCFPKLLAFWLPSKTDRPDDSCGSPCARSHC